jgi:ATP-dependent DNA ligase
MSATSESPLLPLFIKPMLARAGLPFDDANYLFEIKWDGIRMLAFLEAGSYRLMNRHGVDATKRYPEFAFLAGLAPGTILDGEMVVLRAGKPDFALLQSRDKTRSPLKIRTLSQVEPATYIAFDLLYENHLSLLNRPLLERRERLEELIRQWSRPRLLFSQSILGKGRALFAAACRQRLEGIVAKKATSIYRPGKRGPEWIKIKPRLPKTPEIPGIPAQFA